MRATTITNLASPERTLTNVNGALMTIEDTRTSQDFSNIIAGGNPTTDEEWARSRRRGQTRPPTANSC